MSASKINALYLGNVPLSNKFKEIIYPQLISNMPVSCVRMVPLNDFINQDHLDDVDFGDFIYSMDYRHWYYDDDIYEAYLHKISEIQPKKLFVFDAPLDYERPWKVDVETFVYKLYSRTEVLLNILKSESPDTQLIAPCLSVLRPEYKKLYMNYLFHYSDSFDAYRVLCSNSMDDSSIGEISSALMKLCKKIEHPTYILCAVPSGNKIDKTGIIDDNGFQPFSEKDAAWKVKQLFNLFHRITENLSFFYFGIDKDSFDPRRKPRTSDFWEHRLPLNVLIHNENWNWFHFLGLIDHEEKIKAHLLKAIIDLAREHN